MHSVRSTVERRFESYSGSLFSAMKTEYVVVVEQAPPLGPAYSIITYTSVLTWKVRCIGRGRRILSPSSISHISVVEF